MLMKSINSNNNSNNNNGDQKNSGKAIPNYSLGNPLCGKDGVCYLTEEDLIRSVEKAKMSQQQRKR